MSLLKPVLRTLGVAVGLVICSGATAGTIYTFSGNGNAGHVDGISTVAQYNTPTAIIPGSVQGSFYVADSHSIRSVDSAGAVTTLVGSATLGFAGDNGSGSVAFNLPADIALDNASNLYVADKSNHRVRRYDIGGQMISTLAGDGSAGFGGDNGDAAAAQLNAPMGVAVDSSGNIYIADSGNNRIRKVDAATNVITTLLGDGSTSVLNAPEDLVINAQKLYIADTGNGRVQLLDLSSGSVSTVAGGTGVTFFNGNGLAATATNLRTPTDLALDASGNLYISDQGQTRIWVLDMANQQMWTLAGAGWGFSGDGGLATQAQMKNPAGLMVNSLSELYFADSSNQRIRKIDSVSFDTVSGASTTTAAMTTTAGSDGASLYAAHCAGCHGSDPSLGQQKVDNGTSGSVIIAKHPTYVTSAEADLIAAYITAALNGTATTSTTSTTTTTTWDSTSGASPAGGGGWRYALTAVDRSVGDVRFGPPSPISG